MEEHLLARYTGKIISDLLRDAPTWETNNSVDRLVDSYAERQILIMLRRIQVVKENYLNNHDNLPFTFAASYVPWLNALDKRADYLRRQLKARNSLETVGVYSLSSVVEDACKEFR